MFNAMWVSGEWGRRSLRLSVVLSDAQGMSLIVGRALRPLVVPVWRGPICWARPLRLARFWRRYGGGGGCLFSVGTVGLKIE